MSSAGSPIVKSLMEQSLSEKVTQEQRDTIRVSCYTRVGVRSRDVV